MREKNFVVRHFNARALKTAIFSALCRLPAVRAYLNYYQDAASFEESAEPGSVKTLRIDPMRAYAIAFSECERREILGDTHCALDDLRLTYKVARVRDVTILGSSGVSVSSGTGKVLHLDDSRTRMHPNWVVARRLRSIPSDDTATYINLLGVRKGHQHFAHFFWDTMVPLMVYLKNWHDPAERVICLVRENLSAIQRDAFRFIAEDWPNISFQSLRANERMYCRNSIYIAYQNPNHGRDNTLARDYMRMVSDLFLRHYGIEQVPAGKGQRLYISRSDAVLRRVMNETEVITMLRRHGFESFVTGHMPFEEQARLFASADVVVAPHGAGLANLMFCHPGTRVLEFFPSNYIDDGFTRLSRALGLDYHYIVGGKGSVPKLSYEIDIKRLEQDTTTMLRGKDM